MDRFAALRSQLTQCHNLSQVSLPEETHLYRQLLALQQSFQRQVLPLETTADPTLQPILTEINRSLRLLAVDVSFWRSSRQPITQHQRQQQMGVRLTQLGQFLEMLSQRLGD